MRRNLLCATKRNEQAQRQLRIAIGRKEIKTHALRHLFYARFMRGVDAVAADVAHSVRDVLWHMLRADLRLAVLPSAAPAWCPAVATGRRPRSQVRAS